MATRGGTYDMQGMGGYGAAGGTFAGKDLPRMAEAGYVYAPQKAAADLDPYGMWSDKNWIQTSNVTSYNQGGEGSALDGIIAQAFKGGAAGPVSVPQFTGSVSSTAGVSDFWPAMMEQAKTTYGQLMNKYMEEQAPQARAGAIAAGQVPGLGRDNITQALIQRGLNDSYAKWAADSALNTQKVEAGLAAQLAAPWQSLVPDLIKQQNQASLQAQVSKGKMPPGVSSYAKMMGTV